MTDIENTPDSTPPATPGAPEASAAEETPTPEAAPAVETPVAAQEVKAPRKASSASGWSWGLGRRKASVARVRIRPGDGKFIVNKREFGEYFNGERDRKDLVNVLEKTSTEGKIDVYVNVKGGGFTGQAGAIILGLGRAIMDYDQSLEPILRDNNFLTRDPRRVERKKYGQPGARKRFQFSKR